MSTTDAATIRPRHHRAWARRAAAVAALGLVGALAACSSGGSSESAAQAVCEPTPATPDTTVASYAEANAFGAVRVTGAALATYETSGEDPAVGCAAPVIDGQDFAGTPQRIGGVSDRPTLVIVAAHWCPHCNEELPRLVDWIETTDIETQADLVVLSTGVTRQEDNYPPSRWLTNAMGWPLGILADSTDGDAAEALGVAGYPMFVLIGADGTVVERFSGEQDTDTLAAKVQAAIDAGPAANTTAAAGS